MKRFNPESEFSKRIADLTSDGLHCWICLFPLGSRHDHKELEKSRDHVVPQKDGGAFLVGNIRWAHRWCNSTRGHFPLTPDIIRHCRQYIVGRHLKWLVHTRQYTGSVEVEDGRVGEL